MFKLSIECTRFDSNYSTCTGGAVKTYEAALVVLRQKERVHETQFATKIGGERTFSPSYFVL
jgi:hypothetical protein